MSPRCCLAVAVGVAALHGLIAGTVASIPAFYGTVGAERMFDDVHVYYDYASRALAGAVPYRDFPVEYPPLAFPFFLLPRLLAADFARYKLLFALEMLAADAVAVGLVARWVGREGGPKRVAVRLAWYTAAFAVLCPLTVCRFDLLAMAWTFAAASAWHSGRPGLGGILAGSGTLLKLVPGVVAVPGWLGRGDGRGRARAMTGLLAALAVGVALWLAVGGRQVAGSFGYHIERGVEIGSLYAGGLVASAMVLGAPLETVYRHKSLEVITPWSAPVGALGPPLQLAALLAVGWRAARSGGHEPMRYAGAAVLGFVAFGKVLSPQYLIWLLPFAACLGGRLGGWIRGILLLACVVTTMLYPGAFHWLLSFRGWAVGLLNYRNALVVGLWCCWTFGNLEAPIRRGAGRPHVAARGSRRTVYGART